MLGQHFETVGNMLGDGTCQPFCGSNYCLNDKSLDWDDDDDIQEALWDCQKGQYHTQGRTITIGSTRMNTLCFDAWKSDKHCDWECTNGEDSLSKGEENAAINDCKGFPSDGEAPTKATAKKIIYVRSVVPKNESGENFQSHATGASVYDDLATALNAAWKYNLSEFDQEIEFRLMPGFHYMYHRDKEFPYNQNQTQSQKYKFMHANYPRVP